MGTVSDAVANGWLDGLCRGVAYDNDEVWVKLHLGDPGSAGTNNPAANTTRKQVTFGAGAASRAISNTAAVEWLAVGSAETYTHVSFWSASSGGTFLGRDDLSAPAAVTAVDDFRIPIGDLDLTVT